MGNIVRTTGIHIDVVNRYVLCAMETMDVGSVIGADFDPPYTAVLHIEHIIDGAITATDVDIPLEFIASMWRINRPNFRYVLPADTLIVNCSIRSDASSANHSYSVQSNTNSYTVQGNNGFAPQHREGEYLLRDFSKLNVVYRQSGMYHVRDLDWVDTQAASLAQAGAKCLDVAAIAPADAALVAQRKGASVEEAFRYGQDFVDAMGQIGEICGWAANEIRNLQRFSLENREVLRVL